MFGQKKTLIAVYKDELLINQLRKMVEEKDDNDQEIVGTKDESIDVVSWAEKVWLGNKKAGNIQGKILFIGDIKGTDKLIPVIDVQFEKYGVKYGWAGNQAVVFADPKVLKTREEYDKFLEELADMPIPEFLKVTKESTSSSDDGAEDNDESFVIDPERTVTCPVCGAKFPTGMVTCPVCGASLEGLEPDTAKEKKQGIFTKIKRAFSSGADAVASKSEELFRNKNFMKRQMLFYGIVKLYNDGLESFMNK